MNRVSLILVASAVALAGCSGAADKLLEPITGKKDEILPGTRESVLQNTSPLDKGMTKDAATEPIAQPLGAIQRRRAPHVVAEHRPERLLELRVHARFRPGRR